MIRPTMLCMEISNVESMVDATVRDRIRVLLLDDHLLFREGLSRLLASERGFELVAECTTTSEALQTLEHSEESGPR
jgi:hypothetical protein